MNELTLKISNSVLERQLERVETPIHDARVTGTGWDGASDDGIEGIIVGTFIIARAPTS